MKKKSIRKKKKIKEEKKYNWKHLKRKKIKGKKLVTGILGTALLFAIHGATVENILFDDGDGANTFHVFNLTQAFLHLRKKMLLTCCGARANMLAIILLRNGYYLKYIFKKKIYWDNISLFFQIDFYINT